MQASQINHGSGPPEYQPNYQPRSNLQESPQTYFSMISMAKPMATIPLTDRSVVSIPCELLNETKINLTKMVQRTQRNNITVALSVLQSALIALLGLEAAFKSLLSKGDDTTLLTNLYKCIEELKQANTPQTSISSHPLAWLVSDEETSTTDARELFEHCIKVINEFIPCLTGRKGYNSHEFFSQTFGWKGWKQQAQQISVSNLALARLLDSFQGSESEKSKKLENSGQSNKVFIEVRCFNEAIDNIIECFYKETYPSTDVIASIYAMHKVKHSFPQSLKTDFPSDEKQHFLFSQKPKAFLAKIEK